MIPKLNLFKLNKKGRLCPINENDIILKKWCDKYERNFFKQEELLVCSYDGRYLSPIQRTLTDRYYPLSKRERLLKKWCTIENERIKEEKRRKNEQ